MITLTQDRIKKGLLYTYIKMFHMGQNSMETVPSPLILTLPPLFWATLTASSNIIDNWDVGWDVDVANPVTDEVTVEVVEGCDCSIISECGMVDGADIGCMIGFVIRILLTYTSQSCAGKNYSRHNTFTHDDFIWPPLILQISNWWYLNFVRF